MKDKVMRIFEVIVLAVLFAMLLMLPYVVHLELTDNTAVSDMTQLHYDHYVRSMFLSVMIYGGFMYMFYILIKD